MQWADVTAKPSWARLRQFAGLFFVIFIGLALWRAGHGVSGAETWAFAVAGVLVGAMGLLRPSAVYAVYLAWMIAAFPIGWLVSRVIVLAMFVAVFTPAGFVSRMCGRDPLTLQRRPAGSYWSTKPGPTGVRDYFRQF
jgi:Saxitoxin biosynthesis operon protein SxtJ